MRIAAMVLGFIGGLIGILGVWHSPWIPGEYLVWGILSSFIGIAGGTLALKKPKVSGILMLLSAMGGWSAVIAALIFEGFWYLGTHLPTFTFRYIIAGPLLFIGAALSLLACKEYLRGSKSAMILGLIGGLAGILAVDFSTLYFAEVAPETMALALILPAIGIAGGALALTRPASGGTVMLIAVISSILASFLGWPHFAYSGAYMLAGFPLIPGAALSLTASRGYHRVSRLVMALGITAGVLGAFGAMPAFDFRCPVMIPWTILVFLMAVGGGILALTRPKVAGTLMFLSAIAGWLAPVGMLLVGWGVGLELGGIFVAACYFLAGLLLLIGGTLALTSHNKQTAATIATMVLGITGGLIATGGVYTMPDPFMLQEKAALAWGILFPIWVLLFPVMGYIAGLLALAKPKASGILMIVSGISGYLGTFLFLFVLPNRDWHVVWDWHYYVFLLCVLAGLLLIAGGNLSYRKKGSSEGSFPSQHHLAGPS